MTGRSVHTPVLMREVVEALRPEEGEFFVDGTLGGGGYAREIIPRLGPRGRFLGLDWDMWMLERAVKNLREAAPHSDRVMIANENFVNLAQFLAAHDLPKADGIVLDLGLSSDQIEYSGRGFSFRAGSAGEPLKMTYDDARPSVAEVIRKLPVEELARVIRDLSGERYAFRIARAIKEAGAKHPIVTNTDLAEAVSRAVPRSYERGRIHPATRTFLALRIYVNDELENVKRFLDSLEKVLASRGRIAIVTFHSLEDRIVKTYFRDYARIGLLSLITRKPVTPSAEEIKSNPRARSAKLRAAERIT